MATGFMLDPLHVRSSNSKWAAAAALVFQLTFAVVALAAEIGVVGVFPGRGAVLVVDGSRPQSIKIGQTIGSVTLVSVDKTGAVVEEGGKRRTISLGQHLAGGQPSAGRAPQVTIAANERGQFMTESLVNGGTIRFLVDTGASVVALP